MEIMLLFHIFSISLCHGHYNMLLQDRKQGSAHCAAQFILLVIISAGNMITIPKNGNSV
jgi:hypothetical protein